MGLLLNNYYYWFFFFPFFFMFFVTFFPFLCYVEKRQHYRMYSTEKYKSQAQTKGHRTAGYLSSHQPRCQLIAADILPMLLFQSKMFWCIAFFCFFTKRGHSSERPSSLSISIFNKITSLSHSLLWQCSAVSWIQQILLILAWRVKVNCHRFGCQQVKKKKDS